MVLCTHSSTCTYRFVHAQILYSIIQLFYAGVALWTQQVDFVGPKEVDSFTVSYDYGPQRK